MIVAVFVVISSKPLSISVPNQKLLAWAASLNQNVLTERAPIHQRHRPHRRWIGDFDFLEFPLCCVGNSKQYRNRDQGDH